MSELHPQSQSGFSRELWPKRLRDRIGLDAKLYSWRQLAGMFLGGLVLTVGCGFAIYDGTFDASHRYAYTGLRNALVKLLVYLGLSIPLVEFILGLMAIAFFSTGCAYLAAVMLTKRRLRAPARS